MSEEEHDHDSYIVTPAELKAKGDNYRVRYLTWHGPGWYAFYTWTQRCPRNCCDDSCIRAVRFSDELENIREMMIELANRRLFVRAKLKEAEGG